MKRVILAALATMVLAAPAGAAEKLKFAVVPKAMNNPFFDIARDGCTIPHKPTGAAGPTTELTMVGDRGFESLYPSTRLSAGRHCRLAGPGRPAGSRPRIPVF
jgi:hypothetical protein